MPEKCDMIDTDLCKHYQTRYDCMYGRTHGVKKCPKGQPLSYVQKEESQKDE